MTSEGWRAYRFQALVFVVGFSILNLRDLQPVTLPPLPLEDGRESLLFNRVFGRRHTYNGYLGLLVNLGSYIVSLVAVGWRPYFLAAIPILCSTFCLSMFAAPYFRSVVPNDLHRFVVSIALFLLPIGNHDIWLMSYVHWTNAGHSGFLHCCANRI
jgi:hypothetical protein